MIHSRK